MEDKEISDLKLKCRKLSIELSFTYGRIDELKEQCQKRDEMLQSSFDRIDEYRKASENLLNKIKERDEEIKKLKFMIDNGLGWDDMINDITMPHEI